MRFSDGPFLLLRKQTKCDRIDFTPFDWLLSCLQHGLICKDLFKKVHQLDCKFCKNIRLLAV